MNERLTPEDLFYLARQQLLRSFRDKHHPFRFFVLATVDKQHHTPEVRTVVTRHVDSDLNILFFADARSPKVSQIKATLHVSALFWHPQKKLQIRVKGSAEVLPEHDDRFKSGLNAVINSPSKLDYAALYAPGSTADPERLKHDNTAGEIYFAAIVIRPESLDILQLRPDGHIRAVVTPKSGLWHVVNVIP